MGGLFHQIYVNHVQLLLLAYILILSNDTDCILRVKKKKYL